MTKIQVFDSEIARIGGALKARRDALDAPASMLAEAAKALALPEEERLASEAERLKAEAAERQAIEADMARLVAGLAAEIEFRTREFENRDVPTRIEKLIGAVSRAAMRRRQRARWHRCRSLDRLAVLLGHADLLAGLVQAERRSLLAQRASSENDLVSFIERRPEIIDKLRSESAEAMTGIEAARRTERFVEVFQMFVDGLNARVSTCNVLLRKLMVDVDDLLILYHVVSESAPPQQQHGDEGLRTDAFPNLASEVERLAKGILSVHGLDRRRDRANLAFAERFPAEATGEAKAEARPAKAGWRLPTISGFKFARS